MTLLTLLTDSGTKLGRYLIVSSNIHRMKKQLFWISVLAILGTGCSATQGALFVECVDSEESNVHEEVGRIVREALANNPEALLPNLEQYLSDRGVDIEAYQREVEEGLNQPWAERRGINYSDRNSHITLVRSPLNQLSAVIAENAMATQSDVIDSEIEIPNLFGFAYQLVGHDWSIFFWESLNYSRVSGTGEIPKADQLSKALGQPAISLTISDTGGLKAYAVFEYGEISEYFYGTEDCPNSYNLPVQKYILSPYSDIDPEAENQTACFWSSHRQITAEEMLSVSQFTSQSMSELDAYDPDIGVAYLLGRQWPELGRQYTIQNPGFIWQIPFSDREVHSVPDLVRVDFFKFED
ncbi:MAG: hypothetical protein ACFB0G_03800 [Leptolyngbyaceae cyanobacterium]